ncbi:MAG: hypothetical protein HW392_1766 [Steroidobacteraceae bacterium]|nr:hypothetical protein [Steroidobacteraceae bacterium]
MLIRFFLMLRAAGVPVSITEFLALLEALQARLIGPEKGRPEKGTLPFSSWEKGSVPFSGLPFSEQFYHLARAVLVKDERHFDRYDQVFAAHFRR